MSADTINADFILAWLNKWGSQIIVQDLPKGRRSKNRVILQFRQPDSDQLGAVGARDLVSAVLRARQRGAQRFD